MWTVLVHCEVFLCEVFLCEVFFCKGIEIRLCGVACICCNAMAFDGGWCYI